MSDAPPVLPRLLIVTDRHRAAAAGHTLEAAVGAALDAGAPAVVLRERDLPRAQRARLAQRLRTRTSESGAQLWLGGDPSLAAEVGADGVHLPAGAPVERAPGTRVTGRSCHDVSEVEAAVRAGLDHVTVSPVAASSSKPGYGPALGADGMVGLVAAAAGTPVYALGGVTADSVATWCALGAHGVAVLGAVLAADDPGQATTDLLAALETAHPTTPATRSGDLTTQPSGERS